MNKINLDDLFQGISNAIIKANQQIQEQYIKCLEQYFESEGIPIMFDFYVPNNTGEQETYLKFSIPKLTLVPLHSMMMKEVRFDFSIPLSQIVVNMKDSNNAHKNELNAELPDHSSDGSNQFVQIHVTMKDCETPNGVILINDMLYKYIS